MPEISQDAKLRHWARTRSLTIWMLVIWFTFAFVIPWFARELNAFSFIGFPLGYYMIVQGSLIVFVVQIFFQNWMQDRIDDEAGVGEQ